MKRIAVLVCMLLAAGLMIPGCGPSALKVGVIAEITGSIPSVGKSCENAARLASKEINAAGGIVVGGARHKVELLIEDSASKPEKAGAAAKKLIDNDNVLAIVGPNSSSNAVAAADVANASGVLLIAPWSTNPKTTVDAKTGGPKKTVYRACFTDNFEAEALGRFARERLGAAGAAALYDETADVLKNQAGLFKKSFEENGGRVVAFETFKAGDKDFSAQLDRIKNAVPDILFLPSYYTDVAAQVKQARAKGIRATFLGSDAWSTPDLIKMCGPDCEGSYLCNHYSADSPDPLTRKFVKAYRNEYGSAPDDVAALTYDSFGLLKKAVEGAGTPDRAAILEGMGKVTERKGATGTMRFEPGAHDPKKSGVIIRIQNGKFAWFADVFPKPTGVP